MAGPNAGRSGHRWLRLCAQIRSERRPCWLCGQRIDYSLPAGHPDSFTVDHVKPRSLCPEGAEDYANLAAAHMRCNSSRGNANPMPSLGSVSRRW